jgi:hypothetical protein
MTSSAIMALALNTGNGAVTSQSTTPGRRVSWLMSALLQLPLGP